MPLWRNEFQYSGNCIVWPQLVMMKIIMYNHPLLNDSITGFSIMILVALHGTHGHHV